jgi:hypothetical protein
MSEYQYYEFRAIDRPLGQEEMDELRRLSTRAEITPTSFTNTYHWGDFKGKPAALMDRYFDAFVYVANWGTHRLMFRIPRRFLDVETASAYCDGEVFSLNAGKEHVVLEFRSEDESGGEWTEGEPWMPSLITLRADLMRGDLRSLYLGWLASLWPYDPGDEDRWDGEDADGDRLEPPVPPGLAKLSAPLRALADFLRVDDELIEAAAVGSVGEPPAEPSRSDLARWIKRLPASDKDDYLLRFLAEEGDMLLRAELSKRFREATAPKRAGPTSGAERRTVAQLLAARAALVEEKKRKTNERAARERTQHEREQAEARSKYLYNLSEREPAAWREVENLIATKRPNDYDRAVELLVDLRDLAGRSGRSAEAETRIRDLRQRHGNKPSLLKRFDAKEL